MNQETGRTNKLGLAKTAFPQCLFPVWFRIQAEKKEGEIQKVKMALFSESSM